MSCRSCGTELTDEVNFCPNCGFRTEKGETENVRTPVDRRPDWEREVELALHNAQKLMEEAFEKAKKGLQQVREELRDEYGKVKVDLKRRNGPIYCSNCGKKNPSDSEYCVKCGNHLHSQS
jgi:predicted amidophosphoribosyltransferase